MAERKVLNKYYPPDFDPAKLRRFEKKTVRRMCNVRMMLPMSVRCYTCQNYMYLGTKFNMKVETVKDEDYLGIKIYRFYFKCTQCYAEITFKTDPKNHDYVAEWGASRNHEQWRDMLMATEEYKEIKQSEMKEDAMKSLEHRTYDSKREMDILDALDQVKNLNRRHAMVNYDELVEKAVKEKDKQENIQIEENERNEAKEKFKKSKERRIEDYNYASSNSNNLINSGKPNVNDENTIEDSENTFLNQKKVRIENSDEDDEGEDKTELFSNKLNRIVPQRNVQLKKLNFQTPKNLISRGSEKHYTTKEKRVSHGMDFLKLYSDS